MNRLAYDPHKEKIEEWKEIYLNFDQIHQFESLVEKLFMDLQVVRSQKEVIIKKAVNAGPNFAPENGEVQNNLLLLIRGFFFTEKVFKATPSKIQELGKIKERFSEEYLQILNIKNLTGASNTQCLMDLMKSQNPDHTKEMNKGKINLHKLLQTLELNLTCLSDIFTKFYSGYIEEDDRLIQKFTQFKVQVLKGKTDDLKDLIKKTLLQQSKSAIKDLSEQTYADIRVLYENLFIEAQYLNKLIQYNAKAFQNFEEEALESNKQFLSEIKNEHKARMEVLEATVKQLRRQLREMFVSLYRSKQVEIKNHEKLEHLIIGQVAVNVNEYKQTNNTVSFINGFIFAILIFSLVGIMVFRAFNFSTLQTNPSYMTEFKIWRGASYLIMMNWVIGIVLFLFDFFKINYRLVMIEVDTFVPRPQAFLLTATILSAIYLILFLIYMLKAVGTIEGYGLIQHLGYFVWLINILFLLNPFKILNYDGRVYFLKLFGKVLISLFRPMNLNILLVALMMGSFVQPFSDFAFTVCQLCYGQSIDCITEQRDATFIYTMVFIVIRFGHSIRGHLQLKVSKLTRPLYGLIAVCFYANAVISSYAYNFFLYEGLFIYWIISVVTATFGGSHADIRADWGLVSFDKQDPLLRKYLGFPRFVYIFVCLLDFFLLVGWVFNISNNYSFYDSINPMYFLMILSYIELARKGMWIFFRIEDDHSTNVGNLNALLDDTFIYERLRERHGIEVKQPVSKDDSAKERMKTSENLINENENQIDSDSKENAKKLQILQEIQLQVIRKKSYNENVNELGREMRDCLNLIHVLYAKLEWEDEY